MAFFGNRDNAPGATPEPTATTPAGGEGGRISRIGEGIHVKGRIEGGETLRFDGRLEGDVDLQADLIIGPRAEIRATVHAKSIAVEGRVEGDLSADKRIDLVRTARVTGTIKAPSITFAEGAQFDGTIDMGR